MSALTDIFTALANKIRSKTGTQTTYTPAQMVSDGIDDVYDAGYAAGGGGVSPTSITPSDSSPASMTAGNAYEPTANGYAIASSPTSITPSSSGTAFSAGMIKMESSGYAYSSQPSGGFSETQLWKNSAAATSFAGQSITLSQSISNFDYIKISYRLSTTSTTSASIIMLATELQQARIGGCKPAICANISGTGGGNYLRAMSHVSDTELNISGAFKINSTTQNNSYVIPTYVYGLNFT